MFSFVKCDVFVCVVWYQNIDRCFAFKAVNAIYNVYIGILSFCWILIANEVCSMSCDWVTCDLDGYDTIMSGRYLEHWFNNSFCCLLSTVSDVCENLLSFCMLQFFSLSQTYDSEKFFCTSIPNIISVSGSLSHMMKLWVNLKSTILRWSAVIPNAVIGDLSAVFNLVVVGYIGILKLSSINWYVEYMIRDIAAPELIRALWHFL